MSTVERSTPGTADGPALRADARRNLERVLVAAREVFIEQGIDGSVDEIARRAGVGVGTIYRRFPRKEDLVDAIIAEHLSAISVVLREQLEIEDPWEGFTGLLFRTFTLFSENRGFKGVVHARFADGPPEGMLRDLIELNDRIVERAQEVGALRADFSPADLPSIYCAVGAVMDDTREADPRQWERYLSMLLDGLRASAATPTPVGPLALERRISTRSPAAPRC